MDIDDVLQVIGEMGPEQIKYSFILSFLRLCVGLHFNQYAFIRRSIPFSCYQMNEQGQEVLIGVVSTNATDCPQESCSRIAFNTTTESTLETEWDLVCEREWMNPLTFFLTALGMPFGTFIFGIISDKIGRKPTLFLSIFLLVVSTQSGASIVNFPFYCITRVFTGICCGGVHVVVTCMGNEFVTSRKRGFVSIIMSIGWASDFILLSTFAYFFRDWKTLALVCNLTTVPGFLGYFFLQESPRWLLNQNKVEEAKQVLQKIAKGNGKPFPADVQLHSSHQDEHDESKKEGFFSIFKVMRLRLMILSCIVVGLTTFSIYTVLNFLAGPVSGNLYIGTAISGVLELPGDALAAFLLCRFGRKVVGSTLVLTCGVFMVLIYFFAMPQLVVTALVMAAKMLISATFIVYSMHLTELLPTGMRTTGTGFCFFVTYIIGSLCPFILQMDKLSVGLYYLFMGSLCICSGILIIVAFPETMGRKMPETVDDVVKMFHKVPEEVIKGEGDKLAADNKDV